MPHPDEILKKAVSTTDTWNPKLKNYKPENHFTSKDWFNWGGSIIQGDDKKYYLFYSRFPKSIGFLSWLTHSEVAVATSDNASGPWKYSYTALKSRGPGNWDAVTAHNPKIKKFGDSYYLYYISTTAENLSPEDLIETAKKGYRHKNWPTLRNNQRAGVAVSKSLSGPWKRQDKPSVIPTAPVFTITVNPAVVQTPEGKYLMLIKGDKTAKGGQRVQATALSDNPIGPFKIQPKLAIKDFDTEDASIWYDQTRKRYYATYHAHTHYGFITSADGIHWEKAKHPHLAKSFKSADASTFKAERMERPSFYTDKNGIPTTFISSYRKGNQTGIFTIPMKTN